MQTRCLTIQDYSCMGRCSLTVALPILSCVGIETVGLPTAVLSNHTAFEKWTYADLSNQMIPSVDMWEKYHHHFDCIYTGYLGVGQAEIVEAIFQRLKEEDTKIVIDPAFGDDGRLYSGFDDKHVKEMASLLKYADVICPNITEAKAFVGEEYQGEVLSQEQMKQLSQKLASFGPNVVILTGVLTPDGKVGCSIYDIDTNNIETYYTENLPGKYHGAGDTFASVFVGAYLNHVSLFDSVKIAHDFVHKGIQADLDDHLDGLQYGLEFEKNLGWLMEEMKHHMNHKEDEIFRQ